MIPALEDAVNQSPRSEVENDRLYPLLADADAREAMVVNNVRLLQSMVSHFIRRHPQFTHLRDELITEGLGQLAYVVNTLATTPCDRPTAYVITAIRNCLYLTTRNAEIIRVPRCNSTPPPKVVTDYRLLDSIIDSGLWDAEQYRLLFDEVCETDEDRELLTLRLEGNTYRDIERKGLSLGTISARIKRLRKAFLKLRLFKRPIL